MQEAKLYCPNFASVFGEKFANPFWYDNIDSQIWPVVKDIELPKETEKLLSLVSNEHPMFYRRKITLNQLILELDSGDFKTGLVQSLEIGRPYGIPNKLALEICRKSDYLAPIISVIPSKAGLGEIKVLKESYLKDGGIAAVCIYPAYQNFDLLDESIMKEFCSELSELNLPLKVEVSDLHLPRTNFEQIKKEKISTFISYIQEWAPKLKIIIAGAGFPSDLPYYVETLKWNRNVYLEINHRSIGGISPGGYFKQIFQLPGFIQNWWSRILFGSAMPTLESSQMTRGLIGATGDSEFSFAQRNLLRTWGFRNGWRIFGNDARKYPEIEKLNSAIKPHFVKSSEDEFTPNNFRIGYDMILDSFSITQLISFQGLFEEVYKDLKKKYPSIKSGQVTVKSYHTTTSIIMNEHEYGNYIQLHYKFAEETMDNPDDKLHTVAALENRADFNFPDHISASTFGQRNITMPIRDGAITKGGRENLYALVTFGPRQVKISADFTFNVK